MTFWDSSALLPLVVEEPKTSAACRALRRSHRSIAVWLLTRVELASALHRLGREGLLARADLPVALRRLELLAKRWTEIVAVEAVRERAERALAAHPLAAADSLQLAAALVLTSERPRRRPFVTCDERLAAAAAAEGFDAIVPGS